MKGEAQRGAVYNYLNLLLINVTGVLLTPYVIRSLGVSQYGLYTLVGALTPYFALFDFGLGKTVTRFTAHYRAKQDAASERSFLASILRLYLILTLLLLVIGAWFYSQADSIWGAHFTAEELSDVRRMVAVAVASQVVIIPGGVFTAICNGYGLFAFPRAVQPVKYVVRAICVVALLLWGKKAFALVALDALLNMGVIVATYAYVCRHVGFREIFRQKPMNARPILSYSFWIALYAATCALQWNSGQIVAGMVGDAATVGIVGIGIIIGSMYGYFAETINRMALPRAARFMCRPHDPAQLTDEMIRVGRIVVIPQIFILGAFVIFGKDFVALWAGDFYSPAYILAVVMMASWTVQLTQDYANSLLEATGKIRIMSVINFIAIFAGVSASYFASLRWGAIGLVTALGCGTLLATVASNIYYRICLRLETGRYFRSVYARLSVTATAIVVLFRAIEHFVPLRASWVWLLAGGAAYTLLFIAAVPAVVLTNNEKRLFRQLCLRK